MIPRASSSLDLAVQFVDGRGLLALREPCAVGPIAVERLELEVPNLRFPFDAGAPATRFQGRRCQVQRATLRVTEAALRQAVAGRALLARFGIARLAVRIVDGAIALRGEARVGDRTAAFVVRAAVRAVAGEAGTALAIDVEEVTLFGFLPAPAPLLPLGIALGLGAVPLDEEIARPGPAALAVLGRPALRLEGIDRVTVDPLAVAVWSALPRAGFRLPALDGVALADVAVRPGEIALSYEAAPTSGARVATASRGRTAEADALLARGDVGAALEAYAALGVDDRRVVDRRLQILASLPARFDEAVALAVRTGGGASARLVPLTVLAAIAGERGAHDDAAAQWEAAQRLAEAAGDAGAALEAGLRAVEERLRAGGTPEIEWLERTLADEPDHPRAALVLGEAYAALGRYRPLLALERRRLLAATTPAEEAAARVRVARLYLERLDEPERALGELERAVAAAVPGDAQSAEAWRLYGRALDAVGRSAEASEALGRAAALTVAAADAAESLLQAARLAARPRGEGSTTTMALEKALALVEQALVRAPAYLPALAELGAILGRLGRAEAAVTAYERAIAAAPDDEARAPLWYALALLARDQLGDLAAARGWVTRAVSLGGRAQASPAALTLAAELAEADGRTDELEELLARLEAMGDRRAAMRRARLLLRMGASEEAAEAAERLGDDPEALEILVEARRRLPSIEAYRAALEKQVAVTGDAGARLALGQLLAQRGALDEARAVLTEALAASDAAGEGGGRDDARGHRRELLESLVDVLMRLGDDVALEQALGRLARARPADDVQGRARALAAQGAARARLGLTAEAAESFQLALALDPDDVHTRAALGEAAWQLRRYADARAALEPLHERGLAPRVERALRLGEIAERLHDLAGAIRFYQGALDAGASGVDAARAWNGIVALHRTRQDWEAEARALVAAAEDPRTGESDMARASRLTAAADVLRRRLGRTEDALALFDRALELDPFQLAALDALEAMAEADGDLARVEQVLARKVAATAKRPAQQKAILGRLAALQEKLGRPDAAAEAYARALELDPDFAPALRFTIAQARARGDGKVEAAALARLVALAEAGVEGAADDDEARLADLVRLGALVEDPARAEELARRVLAERPRHPAALQLLDETLSRADKKDALLAVLVERAEAAASTEESARFLLRRAELLEQTNRPREALTAYEDLVTRAPVALQPWSRLVSLLRALGEHERLATVLAQMAERRVAAGGEAAATEAEALFVEAAHLLHDRLGRADRAQAVLARAREALPRSVLLLQALLQLARARGDAADEDELLARLVELESDPAARAQRLADRARARQARGDLDGAVALFGDHELEALPDAELRVVIELLEAQREARGEAPARLGRALEVARARAVERGDLAGERWATRRLVRLALDAGPTPAAEALLRRAIELDPDDRESARALAQVERARGDDAAYLVALERLLATARRTFEGAAREAELLVEIAGVLERAGELDLALIRLGEALEAAPPSIAPPIHARRGLLAAARARLLASRGEEPRWAEVAAALEPAAAADALPPDGWAAYAQALTETGDFQRAHQAIKRAPDLVAPEWHAVVAERAGDEAEAVRLWRALVATMPTSGPAGQSIARTVEARRQIARLERRRAERAREAGRDSERRLAAVEVLVADPDDPDALEWASAGLSPTATLALLDELSQRLGPADAGKLYRRAAPGLPADEARRALERAATLAPDPETLVALADREAQAQDPVSRAEAVRRYQQALSLDPGCAEAALGLARIGAPDEAAKALAEARDQVADARTRARLSAALGAILRDRLRDVAGAREAYRLAIVESDGDARDDGMRELRRDALRALAALDRAARDPLSARESLEMLRDEGGATDSDLHQLAELYLEDGATALLLRALEVLGPAGRADELALRALEGLGRWRELAAILEEEAARRPPDHARALYARAAEVAAGPLDDPRRAVALLEKAVPLGPADAALWTRLGQLYARLGDRDRAARALARAWAADPTRTEVLLPLADFHDELGEIEPASDYYRTALAANAVPQSELMRVYLTLARHARQAADAIGEEEALLAAVTFGAQEVAWSRLAELYRQRGDRVRLAGALRHLADRATAAATATAAAGGVASVDAAIDRVAILRELSSLVGGEERLAVDEELLALAPADDEARDRVLEALRRAGDPQALAARLERELQTAPSLTNERRARYALELAELTAQLGDDARAAAAAIQVLTGRDGRDGRGEASAATTLAGARLLVEITRRRGRDDAAGEAAEVLERALFDERLGVTDERDRAQLTRIAWEAHLLPGASPSRALAFLERLRAAGVRLEVTPAEERALLRADHRYAELLAALDRAAADGPEARDPDARLALEIEAAELCDRPLGRPDEAARRYAALLDRHPTRRELAERARQLFTQAGEALNALSALAKEMRLARPDEHAHLKIVRGELLLLAGAHAEAEGEFLHALITTPRVGRAHAALADVYKRRGDVAGALEHLIAAAESPDLEPARAAACARDAADVLVAEGDAATAERLYHLASALDPSDRAAIEGLARLMAARGDHERHVELLGRAALLVVDRRERARIHLLRARIYQYELRREVDAYRALKEAVACDPDLPDAARGLRALAEARGEWALAAEQLYREIAATADAAARARLHIELARILEDKLLDPEAALRNHEAARELAVAAAQPRIAAWADLARLYVNAQRLDDAAAALDAWAEALAVVGDAGAAAQRAEALCRAGELWERLGRPEEAKLRYHRAAALGGEAGRRGDDALSRLSAEDDDAAAEQRRLEERLARTPDGPARVELVRRLLELAVQRAGGGDPERIERYADELLALAPDDALAFVEKKRLLEGRGDDRAVMRLFRARATAVRDPVERAERLFQAGRAAERLGDVAAAGADYEAALAAMPDHVAALDALADLAYRSRQLQRARSLYAQLGDRPSHLAADEVLRRRAELAEELSDVDEAWRLYSAAAQVNPSNLAVQEAIARLALARTASGDASSEMTAYQALRAVLDLLPLDEVDRITELRAKLGRLAAKLGDRDAARTYLELVLSQDPGRADVLEQLVVIYIDQEAWEEAADAYLRLSFLADRADRRAELLFRRGEILRLGLDDLERANDAYLKAADLHPSHAPTLRRLVNYYFREGDMAALADVTRELEQLGASLDEAAVEAGLGTALGGDEARGTVVLAVASPGAARLAEALGVAAGARLGRARDVAELDPAVRAATRALGGADVGRALLLEAARALLAERPSDTGLRLVVARLWELAGYPDATARARLHYGVLAWLDPTSPAAERLRSLGPAQPVDVPDDKRVHPQARGLLRDALVPLAPYVLGLPPAPIAVEPAPEWLERLRPIARVVAGPALERVEAAVVADLVEPAWIEPTRIPRLLLARRVLSDDAAARFAAARAGALLAAGVSLIEGRAPEDVAALVRAAATIFLPDLGPSLLKQGAFVHAWRAELEALPLRPEAMPERTRGHLEIALAAAALDTAVLASGQAYCAAERWSADRAALAATGDSRAALAALAAPDLTTTETRAAALAQSPALVELLRFIDLI